MSFRRSDSCLHTIPVVSEESHLTMSDTLNKKTLLAISICIIVIAIVLISLMDIITPDEITNTQMRMMEFRVCQYFDQHQRFPEKLTELPLRDDKYDDTITDGWGREIHYAIKNGVVYLSSYGKDGGIGGQNKNADIIHTFTCE